MRRRHRDYHDYNIAMVMMCLKRFIRIRRVRSVEKGKRDDFQCFSSVAHSKLMQADIGP